MVTLYNVLVVRESDVALFCKIDGHDRWIPRAKLCEAPRSRGRATLARWWCHVRSRSSGD